MVQEIIPRRFKPFMLIRTFGTYDGALNSLITIIMSLLGLIKHCGQHFDVVYIGNDIEGSIEDINSDLEEGKDVLISFSEGNNEPPIFRNSAYIESINNIDYMKHDMLKLEFQYWRSLPGKLTILHGEHILTSPNNNRYFGSKPMAWVVPAKESKIKSRLYYNLKDIFNTIRFSDTSEYKSFIVADVIKINYPVDHVSAEDATLDFIGLGRIKGSSSSQVLAALKERFMPND